MSTTDTSSRNAATDDLLARMRGIEQPDGHWPAADAVTILCEWFTGLGYDLDAPLDGGSDEEDRTCKRCGDVVAYLSTDDLCDGCVAEDAASDGE